MRLRVLDFTYGAFANILDGASVSDCHLYALVTMNRFDELLILNNDFLKVRISAKTKEISIITGLREI